MATRPQLRGLLLSKGVYADAALAGLVMLIVGMMVVPLPTWLIDLLISANLALSILLLATALYMPHALSFTSLPSVLLLMTLYRLALNVSSTRLILLQADAGRVIRAFGSFVVRGDYVVGAVVFLIISLIQYLVVAKGGERVAEVAARFTLDAMPGKQLAIDADLRAGALRVDAARERRALVERESQFYGAMDGAMKFIKGDAIASLVITAIALIGGAAIGFGSRGLSLRATLQLYGLLAIGDGLVSQLPALVTSIAAGLVVTRVASHEQTASLGQDLIAQLFARPRSLVAAGACLLVLALVPGLPFAPFAVLGVLALLAALGLWRTLTLRAAQQIATRPAAVLNVALGSQLTAAADDPRLSAMQDSVNELVTQITTRLGLARIDASFETRSDLASDACLIELRQAPVWQGRARTLAELNELIASELPALLRRRARELLSLEDVQRRLDDLAEHAPALVRSVVPKPWTLSELTAVLRALLDEHVSVRALERILESLAAAGSGAGDAELGLRQARRALADELTQAHVRAGILTVHRVDPLIEDALRDALHVVNGERLLALPPGQARDIVEAVRKARARHAEAPVLLTQPDIRRSLRQLLADELPDVTVLSYAELATAIEVEEREPISVAFAG